jgi:ABC-type sugar transport system ATPase subunit
VREDRIVRNEALHRELNERVNTLAEDLNTRGVVESEEVGEYFCECGLDDCMEKIAMNRAEYEAVRASPIRFAVKPEHLMANVERLVSQNDRFAVVEKLVGEREPVLEHNPRRP